MSDYPLGAKYDPRAPYNQKEPELVKKKIFVSITLSKSIELEVPEDFDRVALCEAFNSSPEYEELKSLWDKHWNEDEFEIMEDFE
jgi:hypothetical protein